MPLRFLEGTLQIAYDPSSFSSSDFSLVVP
jgi:hypothetical protein